MARFLVRGKRGGYVETKRILKGATPSIIQGFRRHNFKGAKIISAKSNKAAIQKYVGKRFDVLPRTRTRRR